MPTVEPIVCSNLNHKRELGNILECSDLLVTHNLKKIFNKYSYQVRVPRVNSQGKVKTFKCKQCEFVAVTKLEFWKHGRGE